MSSPPKPLRIHLSDAAFHARNMHRSLEAAAAQAQTRRGERKLSRLAKTACDWAIRLDPTTYQRRERRRAKRNRTPAEGRSR